ncbi:MAG: hypothetical protein WKG07_22155 [Hymenobacter sp.]
MNKVESRVELRWHLLASQVLTDAQKALILEKLAPQLTAEGYLLLTAQDDRSQPLRQGNRARALSPTAGEEPARPQAPPRHPARRRGRAQAPGRARKIQS